MKYWLSMSTEVRSIPGLVSVAVWCQGRRKAFLLLLLLLLTTM